MRKRELERRYQQLEQRFFDWQNTAPSRWGGFSIAGPAATTTNTAGLPAASAAIRLISESLGMMPLKIYRGDPPNREVVRDVWQWDRLHDQPNDDQSAFDFWQDVATSIESTGNAFLWKVLARRPVRVPDDFQLYVLDPNAVNVKREGGRKVFKITEGGEQKTYTASRILHIRGWSLVPGADVGVSPITLHREALGKYIATEEFESRFFSNGSVPSYGIKVPGTPKEEDVNRLDEMWHQKYGGLSNMHRPPLFTNGAEPVTLGVSLVDAQFIEQKRYGLEDIARIFRISAVGLLGAYAQGQQTPSVDEDLHRFLQVDMNPRITRVESALRRDRDIFPDPNLFPEFLPDAVLRPDIRTRFAAYKDARQAGLYTANEIRERENLPAHPDGDELQVTPVGGAPNAPNAASNGHGPVQTLTPAAD